MTTEVSSKGVYSDKVLTEPLEDRGQVDNVFLPVDSEFVAIAQETARLVVELLVQPVA
jgi:hypothetical protein